MPIFAPGGSGVGGTGATADARLWVAVGASPPAGTAYDVEATWGFDSSFAGEHTLTLPSALREWTLLQAELGVGTAVARPTRVVLLKEELGQDGDSITLPLEGATNSLTITRTDETTLTLTRAGTGALKLPRVTLIALVGEEGPRGPKGPSGDQGESLQIFVDTPDDEVGEDDALALLYNQTAEQLFLIRKDAGDSTPRTWNYDAATSPTIPFGGDLNGFVTGASFDNDARKLTLTLKAGDPIVVAIPGGGDGEIEDGSITRAKLDDPTKRSIDHADQVLAEVYIVSDTQLEYNHQPVDGSGTLRWNLNYQTLQIVAIPTMPAGVTGTQQFSTFLDSAERLREKSHWLYRTRVGFSIRSGLNQDFELTGNYAFEGLEAINPPLTEAEAEAVPTSLQGLSVEGANIRGLLLDGTKTAPVPLPATGVPAYSTRALALAATPSKSTAFRITEDENHGNRANLVLVSDAGLWLEFPSNRGQFNGVAAIIAALWGDNDGAPSSTSNPLDWTPAQLALTNLRRGDHLLDTESNALYFVLQTGDDLSITRIRLASEKIPRDALADEVLEELGANTFERQMLDRQLLGANITNDLYSPSGATGGKSFHEFLHRLQYTPSQERLYGTYKTAGTDPVRRLVTEHLAVGDEVRLVRRSDFTVVLSATISTKQLIAFGDSGNTEYNFLLTDPVFSGATGDVVYLAKFIGEEGGGGEVVAAVSNAAQPLFSGGATAVASSQASVAAAFGEFLWEWLTDKYPSNNEVASVVTGYSECLIHVTPRGTFYRHRNVSPPRDDILLHNDAAEPVVVQDGIDYSNVVAS